MPEVTRIFLGSDFHIGRPEANYPKIHRFLDLAEKEADEVILNGDIYELLTSEMNTIEVKSPYKEVHERLKSLAQKRKRVRIILGNHDLKLGEHANLLKPIEIVTGNLEVEDFWIEHGHRFDILLLWWFWRHRWLTSLLPSIYQWLTKNKTPSFLKDKDLKRYIQGVWNIHKRALDFARTIARTIARTKPYKGVIIGHTHFRSRIQLPGCQLIDLGDFMAEKCHYAVLKDGEIEQKSF